MHATVILRWALSFAFILTGGYCLARCAGKGHRRVDRVGDLAQGGMAVVMLGMLWAWDRGDAWGLQALVFAAAGAWFTVRALAGKENGPPASPGRGLWHQGLALTAMAWMLLRMPAMPAFATADHTMVGMTRQPVAGLDPLIAGLGAYLLVAPVWWVWRWRNRLVRRPGTHVLVRTSEAVRRVGVTAMADPVCQVLMSMAMGTALLILV